MFELTEEQQALVEMVRDFASVAIAPHAIEWDQTKHFPVDVLREAGALGLGGIYAEEQFGGSGLSRLDAVLIFEELAKADPTIAAYISIHNMVAWMIDPFGNDEQRSRVGAAAGQHGDAGSYCLTEPGAGSDAAALTTSAVRDGDDYVINGAKQFISGAGAADVYVVMARTGDAGAAASPPSWFPTESPGSRSAPTRRRWAGTPSRPAR